MKNAGYLVAIAIAAFFLFRKKPTATGLDAPVQPDTSSRMTLSSNQRSSRLLDLVTWAGSPEPS